ncbi:MAG: DUF433 domain-containing protein [Deltaproteobacteria bacterium]|nr:MAG: DUF433 domain-containing protein [Deltaproteobacteria bacterium]
MAEKIRYAPTLVRTGRGLTIGGTRITLYQIMDFLKAGYPPEEIRDDFGLTIRQMREVTEYIETHRDEAENEYRQVLDLAERNRQYREDRNRERLAQIEKMPPEPEYAGIWDKLQAWKTELARRESLS